MGRRLPTAAWIAATSLLALAATAHAQNADAEALFGEGNALMKQGKLAEACDAFEASNRIEARAGTLIRLGECREANHQLASAWSAYKDALTRVKDPKKKDVATKKIAELEPRLSYLTISVAPESRIEGLAVTRNGQPLDPALWNRGAPVNGGPYAIVARAPSRQDWQTTVTVPDEKGKITVEVPALKEPHKAAPPPVGPNKPGDGKGGDAKPGDGKPGDGKPVPKDEPGPREGEEGTSVSRWTTRRKIAVGAAAGAGVSLVAGILLGTSAKSSKNDAYALCPDPQASCNDADRANALLDKADSRALGANIAFVVAGGAAVAAGVLWLTGAPASGHSVAIAPASNGIVVLGRF